MCALVPMRHASERVVGKNYRPFAGAPLFHHVLTALLACPAVERVVVDTDSPVVREQVRARFVGVELIDRPKHLRPGTVAMTEVLRHDASLIDSSHFLQTHSTNPLLRPETIDAAVDAYFADDEHDSLFSVTRLQTRLYDATGRPMNHDPDELLRTQDLPPVYEENSNLYLFPRELILRAGRRIGSNPLLFEMDPLEAIDIDDEAGFRLAELVYRATRGAPEVELRPDGVRPDGFETASAQGGGR